jgi:hypothetical protein
MSGPYIHIDYEEMVFFLWRCKKKGIRKRGRFYFSGKPENVNKMCRVAKEARIFHCSNWEPRLLRMFWKSLTLLSI